MAEPVGTTLGALGVLGLLSVCIESFNFIEDGRSVGKSFTLLRGEFSNLRFRLHVWSRACKFFDDGGYDRRLDHPQLRTQIYAQLNSISLLFVDAKVVMQKYDVPESSAEVAARGASAGPFEEGFHDFLRRIKKTKSRAGFRGAFLWPLKYKKAFEELIHHLEKCIDALERVTANLDLFDEPHLRKVVEIEIETMSDVEVLDTMIAASETTRAGTMISDAASQRILTLQRENSLASTGSYISHTVLSQQGVDAPVHPRVNNKGVLKVLGLNWQENGHEITGLLRGWLCSWDCEEYQGKQYQPGSEEEFRAPTSFYSASKSLGSIVNMIALSSDLRRLSESVAETMQPLRKRLRVQIFKEAPFRRLLSVLEKTYSQLHPIVISTCDDHFGYLPAVSVLRQLLQITNTRETDVAEMLRNYSFPSLRKGNQWGRESLSILTDFRSPQKLDRLFGQEATSNNASESVLVGILALRLVAIYHFWSLVGALEPQRKSEGDTFQDTGAGNHANQDSDGPFNMLQSSPHTARATTGPMSPAERFIDNNGVKQATKGFVSRNAEGLAV
ncbi:Glycolipid 2-alpha-mannosyltransferase 1 [Apiospora arundinis]